MKRIEKREERLERLEVEENRLKRRGGKGKGRV